MIEQKQELKLDGIGDKVLFREAWKESLKRVPWRFWITIGILGAQVIYFTAFIIKDFMQKGVFYSGIWWAWLIIFTVFAFVFSIATIRGYTNYRDFINLTKFAKANGFSVIEKIEKPTFDGSYLKMGTNLSIFAVLNGIWKTKEFKAFNLLYLARKGGTRSSTYIVGIIIIKLPRKLPHIIFDNKANNLLGDSSMVDVLPDSSQKIELEGDFNKHFDVYVPENYERDMLYFVTPELMALLVDEGKQYDIEVIGDELYIYDENSFQFNDEKDVKRVFKLIESIGGEFSENVRHYKDERAGIRSLNTVADQGKRLRRRGSLWGVGKLTYVVIVITVLFYLWLNYYWG